MGRIRVGKTNVAILNGQADLTIWSDEELMRGQRRDKNGRWGGRPPKVVPTGVHNELVRRRMSKAADLLNESIVDAVALLRQVVKDDDAQYSDRIKAATIIIERVMGKTPEKVELKLDPEPWRKAIEAGIVSIASTDVIDAEVVEDGYG